MDPSLSMRSSMLIVVVLFSMIGVALCTGAGNYTVIPTWIEVDDVVVGNTSERFLSVNFDWWPAGVAQWPQNASAMNSNLNDPRLIYLASQIAPAYWRIGGTPEDHVFYNVSGQLPNTPNLCSFFAWNGTGCVLSAARWDEINQFAEKVGWQVVFGVNAMYGRTNSTTPWDSSNAESLFQYTVEKNYSIAAFEFGNELMEVQAVAPQVLAKDFIRFKALIAKYWPDPATRPLAVGPDSGPYGAGSDLYWMPYLEIAGPYLDVITYHMYLGFGGDPNLPIEFQSPQFLLAIWDTAPLVKAMAARYAPQAQVWMGEGAMAYGGGQNGTTNRFASSMWYAYELAALAQLNHKAMCRQTFIGGMYALVNVTNMQPNPDFFTAVIWKRLVDTEALVTLYNFNSPNLRGFAMCSKNRGGAIVMIIVNNNGADAFNVSITNIGPLSPRNEYSLTAPALNSIVMNLNGAPLMLDSQGQMPAINPRVITAENAPIIMLPFEVRFIEFPNAKQQSCM